MTARDLQRRLKQAEARSEGGRVRVVSGHSEADWEQKKAAMIASGEAAESDVWIYIRKFADPEACA